MIVDDDAVLRALVGMMLKGMGHTDTLRAGNGSETLTLLKRNSADLIICSLSMPGMDGLEVLKACKHDPALKSIPFILMGSGHEQTTTAMEAGADAYLVKPFSPEELRDILRKVESPGP